ncbi:hypothetical protein BCR41DRAFT_363613 [Lobosporangium transversale]|uniref:NADH-ubiquinone reductase complex 1 MLRQ subunit-domain-containing protein n=1 Tax=Lobosporangium transversale TaxID=64571 RepID=A0A1Y2G7L0_9FUNG|nr:hypothetical protein BCR41DRAFT_363613 [Lobosporangium transversale]ORZ00037.1 hypothetical protein BCR41DRAFT_363613 [Lobosporangium transversale]|eukprot:XP_021876078.1 hypothetical protein BCR41DRAFT_363613 [Lobosporangium transversale]
MLTFVFVHCRYINWPLLLPHFLLFTNIFINHFNNRYHYTTTQFLVLQLQNTLVLHSSISITNNTFNMLAQFLRQSMRGMKAPTEVYPLVAVVTGASIGGSYMALRKLATDPHLRRHVSNAHRQ